MGSTALLAGTRVLSQGSILVATVVYARALGPTDRGLYYLVASWVVLTSTFLSGGFGTYIVVTAGRHDASSNQLLGGAFLLSLGLELASVGGGYVLWPVLRAGPLRGLSLSLAMAAFAMVGFSVLTTYLIELYIGIGRVRGLALLTFMTQLATDSLGILLVTVFSLGLSGAVAALALNAVAAPAVLATGLLRSGIRPEFHRGVVLRGLSYGARRQVGLAAGFLLLRVDVLILNAFRSAAEVGVYSIAVAIAEKIWLITAVLSQVAFPHISSATSTEAAAETGRISRQALLVGLGSAGAVALASWLGLRLVFGDAYSGALPLLLLLLPGVIAQPISRAVDVYVAGFRHQPLLASLIALAVMLVGLPIYLATIGAYGAMGAAIGTSVVYLLQAGIAAAVFLRISGTQLSALLPNWHEICELPHSIRSVLRGPAR
jgi:O-antigen/teichoic acid export membrane protein